MIKIDTDKEAASKWQRRKILLIFYPLNELSNKVKILNEATSISLDWTKNEYSSSKFILEKKTQS